HLARRGPWKPSPLGPRPHPRSHVLPRDRFPAGNEFHESTIGLAEEVRATLDGLVPLLRAQAHYDSRGAAAPASPAAPLSLLRRPTASPSKATVATPSPY